MTKWMIGCWALALAAMNLNATTINLGTVANYAVAALNDQKHVTISPYTISGDVLVGACTGNPCLTFQGGSTINGTLYLAPGATETVGGGSTATGGTVTNASSQQNQLQSDFNAIISQIVGLSATQTFGTITGSTTITGNGGLNVIDLSGINLQGGATLSFNGGPSDFFVVVVNGQIKNGGNSNILAGTEGACLLYTSPSPRD